MNGPCRWLSVLVFVLAISVCHSELAVADLGLVFKQARAEPADRVLLYSGRRSNGRASAYPPLEGIEVYFVPLLLAKLQNHLRSRGRPPDTWLPLGPSRQDEHGVVRMWIEVPQVPNGDYTVGFWCRRCALPKGDYFTSAFPGQRWTGRPHYTILRVTKPRPPVSEAAAAARAPERDSGGYSWVLALGGVGALALAAALLGLRRRSSRSARRS
jgi:hypothetical protein